ncbi:hypothetical protein FQR65_LT14410 [Abscondita terminalis]|nr:hypothetical protein FQR65_LT14410 [Abscondita terminalis]
MLGREMRLPCDLQFGYRRKLEVKITPANSGRSLNNIQDTVEKNIQIASDQIKMFHSDSESTETEKRKRTTEMEDSDEDTRAAVKSKKTQRTPTKQKTEDKLDKVLQMLQQLTIDVKLIKLDQTMYNKELSEIKKEHELIKNENVNLRRDYVDLKKELENTTYNRKTGKNRKRNKEE